MKDKRSYDAWLRNSVVETLQCGAVTLEQVVRGCRGADPIQVQAVLAALSHRLPVSGGDRPSKDEEGTVESSLPLPHPLDFDWRFSRSGTSVLMSYVRRLHDGGKLLMLGATTLAIAASRDGWSGLIKSVDRSPGITQAARALGLAADFVARDVTTQETGCADADVVIIDSPWYLESTRSFLLAAVQSCRLGGWVLAVIPGLGTRPGIGLEREELRNWCTQVGLESVALDEQVIRYETPFFERNAHHAAGIEGQLPGWRRGDLWCLRKEQLPPTRRPGRTEGTVWSEVSIGTMRLRLHSQTALEGDTRLLNLITGDILPTVSARDPRRAAAKVWTSGNRIFGCSDPPTLGAALQAMEERLDPISAASHRVGRPLNRGEVRVLTSTCQFLSDLSILEELEAKLPAAPQEDKVRVIVMP